MLKKIFKAAKKAAPIIGGGIGFALGGPMGASIGSGLGSLAGGRSPQDALRNAAIAGAMGYGAKSFLGMPGGKGLGSLKAFGSNFMPNLGAGSALVGQAGGSATQLKTAGSLANPNLLQKAAAFIKAKPLTSAAILAGGLGALSAGKEEEKDPMTPDPFGTMDPFRDLGQADIMPTSIIPYSQYGSSLMGKRNGGIISLQEGGFPRKNGKIAGPGTETSDEIPAMLSDGEFVVNARTVRGLGQAMGGTGKEDTRDRGSKFLYSLQKNYGGKA